MDGLYRLEITRFELLHNCVIIYYRFSQVINPVFFKEKILPHTFSDNALALHCLNKATLRWLYKMVTKQTNKISLDMINEVTIIF